MTVPLSWRASESSSLFPATSGVLELQRLSSSRPLSQLTFIGSYRPPFGVLGAAGDALIGRHVAEAVVHRFVHDVAERLARRSSSPVAGTR